MISIWLNGDENILIEKENFDIREAPYHGNKTICVAYMIDEEFRELPLDNRYLVSNYGRVYNAEKGYMMCPSINDYGYITISILKSITSSAHRLVGITFLDTPENYKEFDINHKDGNKLNNNVDNLEWCTRSYNIQHAFDHGLSKQGEDHPNSTYSNEEVHHMCKMLADGKKARDIAEDIGVKCTKRFRKYISKLVHHQRRKQITKQYF